MVRPRAWSGRTRSTTTRRSAASSARWSSTPIWRSRAGASPTAIGPNYNKAWEAFDPVDLAASLARARMELGLAAKGRASAVERGLIEALQARFPTDDPNDADALHAGHAAYADAMADAGRGVSRRHRRAGAGRRRAGQRHRMGVVGHQHRRAGAGFAGGRGQADPRRRAGDARRPRASRRPAPVPAHHGDVGAPRRTRCPPPTCCAAWCPTPATCSTCPATSTCCAVTTATRWCRICLPCKLIGGSSNARAR